MKPAHLLLPMAAVLCVAGAAACYLGSPRLLFHIASPQGVYRLEFHSASLPQRLAHREFAVPGFYRLYRAGTPPQLMGEGPVVDLLLNSRIEWTRVETGELSVQLESLGFTHIPAECGPPGPCTGAQAPKTTP